MRRSATILLWGQLAAGQANDSYQAAQAAMQESLEKQRASVQKQAESTQPGDAAAAETSFFTFPWPGPAGESFFKIPWTRPVAGVFSTECKPVPPSGLEGYLSRAAHREGLTTGLLQAVVEKESAFRPCAVSRAGAMGLMQIMPSTAQAFRMRDPFDPEENIDTGARFLAGLLNRYRGDLVRALGAYNAGPAVIDSHGGLPPYPETRNYVSGILDRLRSN